MHKFDHHDDTNTLVTRTILSSKFRKASWDDRLTIKADTVGSDWPTELTLRNIVGLQSEIFEK